MNAEVLGFLQFTHVYIDEGAGGFLGTGFDNHALSIYRI